MAHCKHVTVMFIPDGTESRWGFRVPQWLLKTVVAGIAVIIVGVVLLFIFYNDVFERATMTEQVMQENEALRRYRHKVDLLEQNLMHARDIVSRLANMAGVDYRFPEFPDDSTIFAKMKEPGGGAVTRSLSLDWTFPAGLPIQGFITQEFEVEDEEHYHPGIDIACAPGTAVLATASGVVEYADIDSTYGQMLVLRHNDSVVTIYGHNRELLVVEGDEVLVGSCIALSGSTGQSTAPHLHYEIRINDKPLNPLDNPYEKSQQ